ncbi:Pathogenesis-related thaumatin superfamily protein [Abeliophyllum distichum]|uniref:Pathogenesis-related thaumatin superfamily protein n=1 Tax=Abeliophyllum distichum TaxID=126358 RepID=A0ABD1SFT8_9LAMI
MVFSSQTFDKHVIHVNLHSRPKLIGEHLIDKPLIGSPGIFQAKRHNLIAVEAFTACPRAYSYAYDDKTSTFTCVGADYLITFCPSPNSSQKSASGGQNQGSGSDENNTSPSDNGMMVYVGALEVNAAPSTCMDMLRPQAVAGAVAITAAMWRFGQLF